MWRFSFWLLGALLLVFSIVLLLLRFVLLPQVNNYRGDIERTLSETIHLPVSIGSVEGRMQGIRPRLELLDLAIKDEAGRPVLSFNNVVGVVGWRSLLKVSPRFHLLEVVAPVLAIRRDTGGNFFVAGLPVKTDQSGPDLSAWLLDQHSVVIRDASVTWTDELRQAPPLTLDYLNLKIDKTVVGRHRLGVTALPPAALASKLDVRMEFKGNNFADIGQWRGELYGDVASADLAGWHAWVDYPVELTHGRGAARVWLDFADLQATAVTADLSLADVQTRLAPELEVLPLNRLNGRLSLRLREKGFELTTRQLSLATSDGITIAPTNLHLQHDDAGGDFSVNKIDFHALAALATHLPLPEDFRRQLVSYAPRGSLEQFHLSWQGQQWPFVGAGGSSEATGPKSRYTINGSFTGLAIASVGNQPAISGLSGTIDGDEKTGTMLLAGRQSLLSLPAVFHQPVPVDALDARVRWKQDGKNTRLEFSQVKFRNADAEGVASGTYEIRDKGLGIIDLDARLSRADGAAVWRYMPLQAGPRVGPFLHAGLTQGKVTEATLKLKGDLGKFPFVDRSGTFRIHGVFHDAVLRYAEGWPQIDGVAGDIDFDGPTMTITAREARILGVRVSPAKAVIPDLITVDEQLLVEGKAVGPTSSFLKFIEASPVGEQIDHFTEDMTASGNGELNLKLVLPLRQIGQSKVSGNYRFDNNRILLGPDVPPLDAVRGHLDFSAESLSAKGITATMFGLPLKLDMKTQSDGSVLANVSGDASATQLRTQFSYAALKNIAGSARWSGTVNVRKKATEVRISSDLVGLSSSLPEPFNKSARETMPLLFERKPADVRLFARRLRDKDNHSRELEEITLGRALRTQLVYRQDDSQSVFERGVVNMGDGASRLPERGLTVAISQPRIDVDLWRSLLADVTGSSDRSGDKTVTTVIAPKIAPAITTTPVAASENSLMPNRIDLRSPEVQLMGRTFHDVKINANRPAAQWAADVSSRELAAKLEWSGGASPRLSGRVTRLVLPERTPVQSMNGVSVVPGDPLKSLPNLDLTLDHLVFNGRDYGELHIAAENKGSDWQANFTVRNEDGNLEGQTRWRVTTPPATSATSSSIAGSETQTDFKLQARSLERFLNRIGYPNTVKRGSGDINGRLTWQAAPYDFDIASLNGQFLLEARDGQFNKLEPGVGRLLGILSLQSIPRRITLDFRDIFSDGLAFDQVKGEVAITKGVLNTEDMEILGPAARIQMAGSVDMNNETQDLKVRVQPKFSDSVATGVLIASPVIGATAWVFNKVFGNPLDNAFAYDYAVTGGWADPKVDKVGAQSGGRDKAAGDKAAAGNATDRKAGK